MTQQEAQRRGSPVLSTPDEPSLLAEAKLAPPRDRPGLIKRPQLFSALDAGASTQLTLVAAPVGYGKTSTVQTWYEARRPSLAWLNLDEGDNDPWRLWRYVATAVNRIREGLGRAALQRLSVAGIALEDVVDELMNGIAAYDGELVIVLDDFHAVTDPLCVGSVDYAIQRLPGRARMIVVSRSDPALRLAQRRARGEVTEIRTHELSFTASEVQEALVGREDLALGPEEIEILRERTEGWPAAIHLAALWLRKVDNPARSVREFDGDHRFIADYLSEEVLAALDDDTRSFLLQASVLGEFTADLTDDVFERTDGATMLAELERSNLFVVPLEHGWYRIHSLFASFASFQLGGRDPASLAAIHHRAALALRERGLAPEAAVHAHAAGQHDLIAEILVEHRFELIRRGVGKTLFRWVRELPDETLVEHPELAAAAATAATMINAGTIEVRRLLSLVERSRRERPDAMTPEADAVYDLVCAATLEGGVRHAVEAGRRAVETASDADEVLVAALAAYARALYFAGDLDGAWSAAQQAVEHPDAERRIPGVTFARTTLCLAAAERGDVDSAAHQLDAAMSLGRANTTTWLGATLLAARGVVLEAQNDLATAERELGRAERGLRDEVPTAHHAWALLLLARVGCRRGRLDAAEQALAAAVLEADGLGAVGTIAGIATSVKLELEQLRARAGAGELLESPSEAELAVLRLLSSSMSTRELAGALYLSPNTVRTHTRALYRKLGVHSRSDAVARATALGLIGQTDSSG